MLVSIPMLLWSTPTWACAVCGGAGPNQQAFLDTMVFMSLSPLIMLGGLIGFIVWKVKNLPDDLPVPATMPVAVSVDTTSNGSPGQGSTAS